jgi:hypothetical protein
VKEGSRGIWDLGLGIGDRRLEIGDLADSIQFEGENSLLVCQAAFTFGLLQAQSSGKKAAPSKCFPLHPVNLHIRTFPSSRTLGLSTVEHFPYH